jgi:hypothetical protein
VRGVAKVVEKWRFENPIMAQSWLGVAWMQLICG